MQLLACLQTRQRLYLPLIALGELYTGAYRSAVPQRQIEQIARFLKMVAVLRPDETTAEYFGQIHAELAKAGTPIPQNDVWIAALAREHQLPLVTFDAHFNHVSGLNVQTW